MLGEVSIFLSQDDTSGTIPGLKLNCNFEPSDVDLKTGFFGISVRS